MKKKKSARSAAAREGAPFLQQLDRSLSLSEHGNMTKLERLDDVRNMTQAFEKNRGYVKHVDDLFNGEREAFYDYLDKMMPPLTEALYGDSRTTLEFDGDGKDVLRTYKLTRVQSTAISYDVDRLATALGPKLAKRAIKRRYTVADTDGLVRLCKDHGISKAELMACLDAERTVDEAALDKMVDVGDVAIDALEGTFTVHEGKRYYRITSRERKPHERRG